jgi:hypothetical protein
VLLEHAELLHADRRDEAGAPLLGEAIEIFTRLRATPHHDRAQALSAGRGLVRESHNLCQVSVGPEAGAVTLAAAQLPEKVHAMIGRRRLGSRRLESRRLRARHRDDRFRSPVARPRAIALATKDSSAGSTLDDRNATIWIVRASSATRSPLPIRSLTPAPSEPAGADALHK